MNISLSKLSPGEAPEAWKLIKRVFDAYVAPDYSEEGSRTFYQLITPDFLAGWRENGRISIVAKCEDRIGGIIDVRDGNHICLFFVDSHLQNQGIGRLLFRAMLEELERQKGIDFIEVNSSPYAVSIYSKLGFLAASPEQCISGIRFTRMEYRPPVRCVEDDVPGLYAIVNDAAQAYKGKIPDDRWHEPYMPIDELRSEIAHGVVFWGYRKAGELVGVMGIQDVGDVSLIRHAYVKTSLRKGGIGGRLLKHLLTLTDKPILIGTWKAADWAIRFYEKHGFALVTEEEKNLLLKKYWRIHDRQVETSVVLGDGRGIEFVRSSGRRLRQAR
jgi:GNAT superfamily N-acetyltransferase